MEKRKSSRQVIITITEKNEEKKKEENTYKSFKIGPPNILKITLITLLAFTLIPLSAANPANPNGYRLSATKTDFRDVQHNRKLIEDVENGVEQSCQSIITLSDECHKEDSTC